MSIGYLFATSAFEQLLHGQASVEDFKWASRYYVLPAQRAAIDSMSAGRQRDELLQTFVLLRLRASALETALAGPNEQDRGAEPLLGLLARYRSADEAALRDEDVTLLTVALRNQFCVVTDDALVASAMAHLGGDAMLLDELLVERPGLPVQA